MDRILDAVSLRKVRGLPLVLGGHRIGKLLPDERVAYFRVEWRRHFFRKKASWTLDRALLEDLRGRADVVVFDDEEFGKTWAASLKDFLELSELTNNATGLKAALHCRHWELVASTYHEPRQTPVLPRQGDFFGWGYAPA